MTRPCICGACNEKFEGPPCLHDYVAPKCPACGSDDIGEAVEPGNTPASATLATKHTPGPWRLTNGDGVDVSVDYESPGHYNNLRIVGPNNEHIVGCDEYHVFGPWLSSDEAKANILLLMPAPTLAAQVDRMREALAEVTRRLSMVSDRYAADETAIQKARALLATLPAEQTVKL